jgi:hypothetical protein
MQTKAGLKLRSRTCTTEVIVVRAAPDPVELSCCGAPMTTDEVGEVPTGAADEVLLGKRYTDEQTGLEVLCTKSGPGALAADGRALLLKGAKPLPSSD